ncbi:hypothetical protein BGZ67_003436 [Mortierella alpina]|nr:hypothetical protein BGZ67_003436 [Mortierella alpina]
MAKLAKHARPTSLPKKKSHAPPESAARAGGTSAAARLQEISRTASSLPLPASAASRSAMPTHARLVNQSRFLPPAKLYEDHLKASPKASRTQRTAPGLPLFSVRTAPSPKSANRLQSSPLNRANASMASSRKPERTQANTRYSISDLEMKTPISIPSDDSSDDMPGNSGLHSKDTLKSARAPPKSSESTMEPVQTFLRLRPPHPAAADREESHSYVDILNSTDVLMTPPPSARAKSPSKYTFTKVFDPTATQTDVFKDACTPLLTPLLKQDDCNAILFAYGASASGKTHSIIGSNIPDQAGILPRTLDVLFKSIRAIATDSGEASQYRPVGFRDVEKVDPAGLGQSMSSEKKRRSQIKTFRRMARRYSKTTGLGDPTTGFEIPTHGNSVDYDGDAIPLPKGMDYTVWISCAELYTEKIYDLLEDPAPGTQSLLLSAMGTKRQELHLKKDNSTGHKYIDGLKEVEVRTLEEALLVLGAGLGRRQVYSKLRNKFSSRSHCIFTIKVLKTPQFGSSATEDAAKGKTSVARLTIVDLAGPERFQGIKNRDQRPKEAGNINTSLMVLGHCMEVLRLNQNKSCKIPQPVPFRHSILTQLFQCALEGKSASTRVTLLIASDPHRNEFDETTQALRFASTPMDVSTPFKNDKQSFENVISDLYEKIGAMEREREQMDEEIKAAVIEQVKNEVLGEMADRRRRERIETASAATQTPTTAPMDITTPTPTKLISLKKASPVTNQDGSDEVHTNLGLVSEINRLKRLLEEANQRNAAWQSWHLSAPCFAPLTASRTAASPIHTGHEMAMDLEEEPASTEDKLCVVVYQAQPEPNAEGAEQERLIPIALEETVAEDAQDDEEGATTMDHAFGVADDMATMDHALGVADDVTSIGIENCGLPSHSLTTPNSEEDGMQSVDEMDQLNSDESDGLNSDKGDAATTHCLTVLDPAEGPARDNAVHDKIPDVSHVDLTAETTSSDQDKLIDDHSRPDEETASLSPSSPRQSLPPASQCAVVAVDTPTEPCAHRESSAGFSSQLVSEDSEAQESSAVLMPFFSRSMEVAADCKDVSPANEPEPTTFISDEELPTTYTRDEEMPITYTRDEEMPTTYTRDEEPPTTYTRDEEPPTTCMPDEEPPTTCMPDEEPPTTCMPDEELPTTTCTSDEELPGTCTPDEPLDLENGTCPPHNPPGSTYWGPNPFNLQGGSKNLEDVKECGNVREYENVEEYENIRECDDAQEYDDVDDVEDVERLEDVKDHEDVETYEDVKEYDDVEKFEDLREYEDVSPAEDPLPETFALGASSPRSRSGSPYWDASSLSPQVITQEFEEPEPGQTILPPHTPPPQTPPPQTPPRQTPPRRSPLVSPLWEAGPFHFKMDDQYGSEADADQVSTQLTAHEEARQPYDAHETLFVDIAPLTPKRKRKLRQKNAVFEEEMGESVGLPPPEAMTRRKRTRRWD